MMTSVWPDIDVHQPSSDRVIPFDAFMPAS